MLGFLLGKQKGVRLAAWGLGGICRRGKAVGLDRMAQPKFQSVQRSQGEFGGDFFCAGGRACRLVAGAFVGVPGVLCGLLSSQVRLIGGRLETVSALSCGTVICCGARCWLEQGEVPCCHSSLPGLDGAKWHLCASDFQASSSLLPHRLAIIVCSWWLFICARLPPELH